jgi:DNA-binding transcriptional MerR regulator
LQALNNLLTALAEIEESDMSAEDIRQLLHLPSKPQPAARPAATAPVPDQQLLRQQQQQQQLGRQQQQQQQQQAMSARSSSSSSGGRPLSPDSLQAAARQLGQLSPELAQEWYDRALQQGLQQVRGWDGCCAVSTCFLLWYQAAASGFSAFVRQTRAGDCGFVFSQHRIKWPCQAFYGPAVLPHDIAPSQPHALL